jgi:hypothetical protein
MNTIDADDILNAGSADAVRILGKDAKAIRKAFHRLAAIWHPDVCSDPRSGEVFTRLVELREMAEKRVPIRAGRRQRTAPPREFETMDGHRIGMRPLSTARGATGEILVCEHSVTFLHDADWADFADREEQAISGFCFPSDRVRKDMERFLPKIVKRMDLKDGRSALSVARDNDDILLSDLIAKGPLEPVHAAWVCSSLMNIASWLYWSDACHGAIEPRHILISPAGHSVKLVGGWGSATQLGERPEALPERTLSILPRLALSGEVTSPKDDLELIRRTVCEALGDPSGTRLHEIGMPQSLINWLTFPPAEHAVADYAAWEKVRDTAWERRFVALEVSPADVYGG